MVPSYVAYILFFTATACCFMCFLMAYTETKVLRDWKKRLSKSSCDPFDFFKGHCKEARRNEHGYFITAVFCTAMTAGGGITAYQVSNPSALVPFVLAVFVVSLLYSQGFFTDTLDMLKRAWKNN